MFTDTFLSIEEQKKNVRNGHEKHPDDKGGEFVDDFEEQFGQHKRLAGTAGGQEGQAV